MSGVSSTFNSQYEKWFREIERNLWSFFKPFGDLCRRCAGYTLACLERGDRRDIPNWTCCMIDNQVHDNWELLNAHQCRYDRDWYDKLKPRAWRPERHRMPGNGPCPALSEKGCLLQKMRPITCTTQLCPKMLQVLNDLGLIRTKAASALQIEDLIRLPDILPVLYGSRKGKVETAQVQEYLTALREFRQRFESVPPDVREAAITKALPAV